MTELLFKLGGLDHVVLRARDGKRLVAFYTDVLGCTVERELDVGLVQLRAGLSLIDIIDANSRLGQAGGPAPGENGHNLDHFCLGIEPFNLPELEHYLRTHNVAFESAARVYGAQGFGPAVYIKDPEGNTVELKGPPDDESA